MKGLKMLKNFYEGADGAYHDKWESLDANDRSTQVRKKLHDYIQFVKSSTPFYSDRLSAYDAKADHPLRHVPVLKAEHLREHVPPFGSKLLSNSDQYYTVFQSGGTTGIPKTSLFTHEELEGLNLPNSRGFFATGLNKDDKVANLFAVGGLYMTFIHINRMAQQYGCTNFPFSNHTPPDFIKTVVELFKVNCFTGITSVVLNCLREMYEQGLTNHQIDKIYYGGEHIYPADMQEMKRKFGTEIIHAPGYGTVDTWYLGYQVLGCDHGVFNVHDDQVYLEIVDEEKLDEKGFPTHCAPGEIGMLYATAYPRRQTPVVRYRVGDKACWIKEPCPSGRTTPRFKLYGRGDDVLRIGYDSIDYEAIQSTLSKFPELTATIQMEKKRREGRDLLIIRVESEASQDQYADLKHKVSETLLTDRPSFRDFVKKGTIWPVEIEITPLNSLPRNPRTGKLIRVIDSL